AAVVSTASSRETERAMPSELPASADNPRRHRAEEGTGALAAKGSRVQRAAPEPRSACTFLELRAGVPKSQAGCRAGSGMGPFPKRGGRSPTAEPRVGPDHKSCLPKADDSTS